mmetsp:Transcript_47707/g.55783  ORF Transcript_47707/g.55783 Transcript_47707/m.55783 type:complete len:148 (-) Transcript_47707:641-1084(-)
MPNYSVNLCYHYHTRIAATTNVVEYALMAKQLLATDAQGDTALHIATRGISLSLISSAHACSHPPHGDGTNHNRDDISTNAKRKTLLPSVTSAQNKQGEMPLFLACHVGNNELVRNILLSFGKNNSTAVATLLSIPDNQGCTSLVPP